jgi:hypothetical protein
LHSTDTFSKATVFQSTSNSLQQQASFPKQLLSKQPSLYFDIFTMSDSNNNNATVAEVSKNLTTLNINDIPEMVQPYGPMFSRLPNEILFRILEWYMLIGPLFIPGRVTFRERFRYLNGMDCLKRVRSLNKSFHDIAMQCFYMFNKFSFTVEHDLNGLAHTFTPPVFVRQHLRRVGLQLFLDVHNGMTTVEQLTAGSSAARLLRDFNSDTVGFTNLVDLVLDLHMDIMVARGGNQPVMAVIKKADFVVRARGGVVFAHMVVLTPGSGHGRVPFPELAALVKVVE